MNWYWPTVKTVWTFLNSSLFLTLLTIGLGSCVAARLTARWQRASLVFQLRVDTMRRIVDEYMRWADSFYQCNPLLIVDRLAEMAGTIRFAKIIFPSDDAHKALQSFWNCADARSRSSPSLNQTQLAQLQAAAADAFHEMVRTLTEKIGIRQ